MTHERVYMARIRFFQSVHLIYFAVCADVIPTFLDIYIYISRFESFYSWPMGRSFLCLFNIPLFKSQLPAFYFKTFFMLICDIAGLNR